MRTVHVVNYLSSFMSVGETPIIWIFGRTTLTIVIQMYKNNTEQNTQRTHLM